MNNYVRDRNRAASPQHSQNGQHINPDRQAIAANAKVSIRRGPHTQQTHQAQAQSGLPARGVGNAQNSSAAMQRPSQRRHLGQDQGYDPYGTDGESIDTTVDQSVVQVEDSPGRDSQNQQNGRAVDLGGVSDEEGSQDDEEGEEGEDQHDKHVFTQQEADFLESRGQAHLSRSEAAEYLHSARGFPVVQGDSYPPTTDGNLTEWQGGQEPTSEDLNDVGPVSPSPSHDHFNGQRPYAAPPMHNGFVVPSIGQSMHIQNKIFERSAHLRGQQRVSVHPQQAGQGFPPSVAPLMSSQPPLYSQANRGAPHAQVVNPHTHLDHHAVPGQPQQFYPEQPPDLIHATSQLVRPSAALVPAQPLSSLRIKGIPTVQRQLVQQPPISNLVQGSSVDPDLDYDLVKLYAMDFNELRDESFDSNPRHIEQPLSQDMLQRPLAERLTHVQQNFDTAKQSNFFRNLTTTEWEDTGDWFLDEFSNIIRRTKEARQKKRKLAREFEDEIKTRHKHVSRKHRQVEDAMSKMQVQGQGLVPRSPRPSKSPKPSQR
jgi:hypothetical protein